MSGYTTQNENGWWNIYRGIFQILRSSRIQQTKKNTLEWSKNEKNAATDRRKPRNTSYRFSA